MTLANMQAELQQSLLSLYEAREAAAISSLVMEKLTGLRKSGWIIAKQDEVSEHVRSQFELYKTALVSRQPVQYVLGEAWFAGMKLFVNKSVLIPRPETEELVHWLLEETTNAAPADMVLDIGTGSGCIALAIKKNRPAFNVLACDISADALIVAQRNARQEKLEVSFVQLDILSADAATILPPVRYIISNPPYIPVREEKILPINVRFHEPATALFVPDENPLLFYKAIAALAEAILLPGGKIFFEIHEDFGQELQDYFSARTFTVLVKKDIFGKSRMAKLEKL